MPTIHIIKKSILFATMLTLTTGLFHTDFQSNAKEIERSIQDMQIFYNPAHFPDQEENYVPNVSEVISYSNGDKEITPDYLLSVSCEKNDQKDGYKLDVISNYNHYQADVPIITVTSITTKTKVSTKKALSADKLKLYLHYSDGSIKKADSADITSDRIKKPKEGKNVLNCYYKNQTYKVKVKAYDPDRKVSFKGYGEFTLSPSKEYKVPDATRLTKSMGVTHFNDHRETYYSQRVLPGTALDIPGRHVADDGTVRDKDGYICVASDYGFYSKYEVLLTSLGPAKVYDTGCAHGTIDIYVNW